MRFYDDSDEIITNMVTGFLFVAKIEIKIELENEGITVEGAYAFNSLTVSYVADGIVNVFENLVGGTVAVEYTLTGDSINTGGAGDLSITVNADGTGSYSSSNEFIGSGTF